MALRKDMTTQESHIHNLTLGTVLVSAGMEENRGVFTRVFLSNK